MIVEIALTVVEARYARQIGVSRQTDNIKVGAKDRYGAEKERGMDYNIIGCLGEMAVAKMMNIPWDGALGDYSAADVGDLQVRTRKKHYGKNGFMRLHDRDRGDDVFISCYLISDPPGTTDKISSMISVMVEGWVHASEGKVKKYWGDRFKNGRPAYFVPPSVMSDIMELI